MRHGFIKVAAATPDIRVADCGYNAERIEAAIYGAASKGAQLLVLPELCITGYTCGDLFYQSALLDGARSALLRIAEYTKKPECSDILVFVGLPIASEHKIFNVAAAVKGGEILGLVPKSYLPNYNEFYDKRQFSSGKGVSLTVRLGGRELRLSDRMLFECESLRELTVAAEICEDLWVAAPPSSRHAEAGATLIVNLSASNETVGKYDYRKALVTGQSGRLIAGYVYASAGYGESTTDVVFSGHNIIAENARLLSQSKLFENGMIISEIDVSALRFERSKLFNYGGQEETRPASGYTVIPFCFKERETLLTRAYDRHPFVPKDESQLEARAELILSMQAQALRKRLSQGFKAVIGLSGGLDSTLALLVAVRAVKLLERPPEDIIAVTMPCFGTTDRTYRNACGLAEAFKVKFASIDISKSVEGHLEDISAFHDKRLRDPAYENAQARERTQVLMDIANSSNGIVIGTGDLSEFALGWCTYNGDHMSMYAVNASVPKTLVRYLVGYEAKRLKGKTEKLLREIISTPVTPELLPSENGGIEQRTEEIIGPYELHDFFLYYTVRFGFSPDKVFRLAKYAFDGAYDRRTIKKWLTVFVERFFKNQFKRNCMPDGVKIGSVSLSPRGDWRMPSDASVKLWLDKLKDIE